MKIHHLAIAAGALLACACTTNSTSPQTTPYQPLYGGLSPEDWRRLTLCGAGFKNGLDLSLQYKVAQDIRSGSLSAGVAQELQTAFLADSTFPAADREKAYEAYLGCVKDIQVSPHP